MTQLLGETTTDQHEAVSYGQLQNHEAELRIADSWEEVVGVRSDVLDREIATAQDVKEEFQKRYEAKLSAYEHSLLKARAVSLELHAAGEEYTSLTETLRMLDRTIDTQDDTVTQLRFQRDAVVKEKEQTGNEILGLIPSRIHGSSNDSAEQEKHYDDPNDAIAAALAELGIDPQTGMPSASEETPAGRKMRMETYYHLLLEKNALLDGQLEHEEAMLAALNADRQELHGQLAVSINRLRELKALLDNTMEQVSVEELDRRLRAAPTRAELMVMALAYSAIEQSQQVQTSVNVEVRP